jgi:hypothetical protein
MQCIYIICYKRLYSDTHWLYRYLLKLFEHNFHTFINYGTAITEGTHVSNIIYLCSFLPAEKLSEQMNRLSEELIEHKARIFHTHTHTCHTHLLWTMKMHIHVLILWNWTLTFPGIIFRLWGCTHTHTHTQIPTWHFTDLFSRTHISLSLSPQTHCFLRKRNV